MDNVNFPDLPSANLEELPSATIPMPSPRATTWTTNWPG